MQPTTEHDHVFIADSCCYACFWAADPNRPRTIFMVCSTCGNKRCPKATDHDYDCTGSNESGQEGSYYGGVVRTDAELDAAVEAVLQRHDDAPTVEE